MNPLSRLFPFLNPPSPEVTDKFALSTFISYALGSLGVKRDPTPWIEALPHELLVHVFSYLQPQELGSCLFVNKAWHECAKTDSLWKEICLRQHLPPLSQEEMNMGFNVHYLRFSPHAVRNKSFRKRALSYVDLENTLRSNNSSSFNMRDNPLALAVFHGTMLAYPTERYAEIWDLKEGVCKMSVKDRVNALDFNDQWLITTHSKENGLELNQWNLRTTQCASTFNLSIKQASHILLHDGYLCIAAQNVLSFLDQSEERIVQEFVHEKSVVSIYQEESVIFSACWDQKIYIWDLRSGKNAGAMSDELDKTNHWSNLSYHLLLQGETLVACNYRTIKFWDLRKGKSIFAFEESPKFSPCIDLQGKVLARGQWGDGSLSLWDIEKMNRLAVLSTKGEDLAAIRWLEGSLMGIKNNGKILLWEE